MVQYTENGCKRKERDYAHDEKLYRGGVHSCCRTLAVLAALCVATAPSPSSAADLYSYNTANGTANLGSSTHLDNTSSSYRFIVRKGTVNFNAGSYIRAGGNDEGVCNFIGVDEASAANVNINNGGTLWLTKSGGGAGCLGVGINNKAVTSTLTVNNGGLLIVEGRLRSGVQYNGLTGATSSGTFTLAGGIARVNELVIGANSANTGGSTVNISGGRLYTTNINFRAYNGQSFKWDNGRIVAGADDIFHIEDYVSENSKTRTMQITGSPAVFDTAGFHQTIPEFTATSSGRLWVTGGGTVAFEDSTLPYYLHLDNVTVELGTLDSSTPALTAPGLEIVGPVTLNVTLPESPSGRYPLISCNYIPAGSPGQITVVGGGAGKTIIDGTAIYLSFEDDATALAYSDSAGGSATFDEATSGTSLAFGSAAGAYTLSGETLTLSQGVSDRSTAAQTISAPVALSTTGASIYVEDGGSLEFSGGLTATTPLKIGAGTLVLSGSTRPSAINFREGGLDFGGGTYSGSINFFLNNDVTTYFDRSLSLRNGAYSVSGNFNTKGGTLTIKDGFTFTVNARIAVGYGENFVDATDYTAVVIDGGTMTTVGDSGNNCNFVGVDRAGTNVLEVVRGSYSTTKYMRIAANSTSCLVGIVRVRGGTFRVGQDLTMATVYNGTNGGTGTALFEQSGGTAVVGNFYLGGTSSNIGSGTVNLTGGVLEVGCLKCLAYNTQTLVADGGTIRATGADTAAAPFMAKVASADSYAKTYTIGEGGLTIDTAGYDVHCDIPWTGTGGLTVMGGGSLALAQTLAVAGDSVISNGTTLVVTNSIAFGGNVTLGADAKIRFDTTSFTEDSLVFATDGFTLPEGADDVLDFVEIVGDSYVASVSADGKSIELSLAANVAAFAWWTGGGDPTDLSDPANWACTNSTGGVVENALPVKSTVVVLSGTTSFSVPAGTTPAWATTQIGNGGAVTLGADCDWSAAPNVTIADGSYIDLAGHNLKISNLTAADGYDAAYVTNSVAGVKPALWAENKFAETDYIDTDNVTVYTDNLEVKSVNNATFTAVAADLAATLDAGVVVTSGTMSVNGTVHGDATYFGVNGCTATLCLTNNAVANFNVGIHLGNGGSSSGSIIVADSATFNLNYLNMGYHTSGTSLCTQDGGTVSITKDLNVGTGNSGAAYYEMNGGTLTVNGSLVPGRGHNSLTGSGLFLQSGGTVNAKSYLTIGYALGDGTYRMTGGELFATNKNVILAQGDAGTAGLFDIAGGVATCTEGMNIGHTSGRTGTVRVRNGGRLIAKSLYKGDGTAIVEFDGGILEAAADAPKLLNGISSVSFGAGGVTLDNGGFSVGFNNCTLEAAPDFTALSMSGGGTLTLSDVSLSLSAKPKGSYVFARATGGGRFSGVPTLNLPRWRAVIPADGSKISILAPGFSFCVR